jgi:hypothetical protein
MRLTNATVRFNLAKGKRYMKWKVEDENNTLYIDPSEHRLIMTSCKSVCAWIQCKEVLILPSDENQVESGNLLRYNPRERPHWTNANNEDLDGHSFQFIKSKNKQLTYVK